MSTWQLLFENGHNRLDFIQFGGRKKTFLPAFSMPEVFFFITHKYTQIQLFCRAMCIALSHANTMYFQSSELTDVSFYWEEEVWLPYAQIFPKHILCLYLEILTEEAKWLCTCVWHFWTSSFPVLIAQLNATMRMQ